MKRGSSKHKMKNPQAALLWITKLLKQFEVPYQIAGGLAARAYGATRELVDIDIDIPQDGFNKIYDSVNEYIIDGPKQYQDNQWDLYVMTLLYQGQEIDLTSTDNLRIFNVLTNKWELLITDLSKACLLDLMGINVSVIPVEDLLSYKKILRRQVDLVDIEAIESIQMSHKT